VTVSYTPGSPTSSVREIRPDTRPRRRRRWILWPARASSRASSCWCGKQEACLFCYRVSRRTEYLPRQARDKCIGNVETKAVSAGRQNLGAGQFCPGARNYLAEQGRADAAAAARAATYPPGAKNAAFLHHFVLGLKTIILPRQARDKHGENSKKSTRFLAGVQGCDRVALSRAETFRHRNPRDAARVIGLRSEKKRLLRHFYTKSIILPRQARDKHREKHSKKHNIHACGFCSAGVCVVQLKPQLEALLGLDDDALTKEIKLTQVGAKNAGRFLIGCAILYILKTAIILPRQARDKHGGNNTKLTKEEHAFASCRICSLCLLSTRFHLIFSVSTAITMPREGEKKTPLQLKLNFDHDLNTMIFIKTGSSGQT
jgi:hypothetical protein